MPTAEAPTTKDTPQNTATESSNAVSINAQSTQSSPTESLEQLHLPDVPPPPAIISLTPLRTLREGQGRSVEDIASALRLSQAQINALEDSRWDALPGAAYVKGFLRNYARHLGVDAQAYIDDYTAQTQPQTTSQANNDAPGSLAASPVKKTVSVHAEVLKNDPTALQSFNPSGEEKAPTKGLAAIIGLLIAATLTFLLYWERGLWLPKVEPYVKTVNAWFNSPTKQPQSVSITVPATVSTSTTPLPTDNSPKVDSATVPAQPDVAQNATTPVPTTNTDVVAVAAVVTPPASLTTVKPNEIKKPATGPMRALELQFNKAAWIEVRDSGNNVLYYGTKPEGKQALKGNAPLSVVIGAADAVKLKIDGQAFDVQSKAQGNVARFSIP